MNAPRPARLRHRLEVAGALARELVRSLLLPLHLAWFLCRRSTWRVRFQEALEHAARSPATPALPPAAHLAALDGTIFISAAETSGDHHAASLVRAMRERAPGTRVLAFGGPALVGAGAELEIDLLGRAVMGVRGVLSILPRILSEIRHYVALLDEERPALVIVVDAPSYHLVLARLARKRGIPVLFYICPQLWGWLPWRVGRFRRAVDQAACLLPFEPPWFTSLGVPTRYVGHPELDHWRSLQAAHAVRAREAGAPQLVALLPGSRRSDLKAHLPTMCRVARTLRTTHPTTRFAIAQSNDRQRPLIETLLREHEAAFVELAPLPYPELLQTADLAIVKSGTATLDVGLCRLPMIVIYHLGGRLGRWAYDHLLTVPHFCMVNLLLGETVPEIPYWDVAGEARIVHAARTWLADADARQAVRTKLEDLDRVLAGGAPAVAAGIALEMLTNALDRRSAASMP